MKGTKQIIRALLAILVIISNIIGLHNVKATVQQKKEDDGGYCYYQDETDLIFVVDYSNSMNGNDRNKMALEMIETMIDTSYGEKTSIGLVAYNDSILKKIDITSMAKEANRKELKKALSKIPRSGSTDIGLALREASRLIQKDMKQSEVKKNYHIILISDGEPDLTYSKTGRTLDDCYDDMDEVGTYCSENRVRIDTVAFGNYSGDYDCLKVLANKTEGKSYEAKTAKKLVNIFQDIIKRETLSKIIPVNQNVAYESVNGSSQTDIIFPMKDIPFDEANLLIVSSEPIRSASISYMGEQVSYYQAKNYFTCKVKNGGTKDIKITVSGNSKQEYTAYAMYFCDWNFQLALPKSFEKNNETTIKLIASSKNDSKKEFAMYKDLLEPKLRITSPDEKTIETTLLYQDGSFQMKYLPEITGTYKLSVSIGGDIYRLKKHTIKVKCNNSPPSGTFPSNIKTNRWVGKKTYNLDEYFTDINHDQLNYEFISKDSDKVNITLENGILTLQPGKVGDMKGVLRVTDGDGGLYETKQIHICCGSIFLDYIGIWIGVMIVVCMFIFYLTWIHHKNSIAIRVEYEKEQTKLNEVEPESSFTGKLNAYFTKLPDGMEVDPIEIPLYKMKDKVICFKDLFDDIPMIAAAICAEGIFIKAGKDRDITLYHTTKNVIMIGNTLICRKLKYSIEYGNKIYITSQDGTYELEVHYLSQRS